MANCDKTQIKNLAKLAKKRLKNGFWEECKEKVSESVTKAKEDGLNSSNVIRYYKSEVTRAVGAKDETEEAFYQKVKYILDTYGDVSDIIGRLCDREYMQTLNFQQRERYLSQLAERYRACRERYYQEKRYAISSKGA